MAKGLDTDAYHSGNRLKFGISAAALAFVLAAPAFAQSAPESARKPSFSTETAIGTSWTSSAVRRAVTTMRSLSVRVRMVDCGACGPACCSSAGASITSGAAVTGSGAVWASAGAVQKTASAAADRP